MTNKELTEENAQLKSACEMLSTTSETLRAELAVARKERDALDVRAGEQEKQLQHQQAQLLSLIQSREEATRALVSLINHGVQAAGPRQAPRP